MGGWSPRDADGPGMGERSSEDGVGRGDGVWVPDAKRREKGSSSVAPKVKVRGAA